MNSSHILVVLAGGGLAYLVVKSILSVFFSPLRHIPGPRGKSFFYGNIQDIIEDNNAQTYRQWENTYGKTFLFEGLIGQKFVWTSDWKALGHILNSDADWQKDDGARFSLSRILGSGVLGTEGEKHKLQNPAFGPAQVRELTDVFFEKSSKLRDVWVSQLDRDTGLGRIDALSWISKMTLDVIGEAGFNYKFNALDGEASELNNAYSRIFKSDRSKYDIFFIILAMLQESFPIFRVIPEIRASFRQAMQTSDRIAKELFYESKAALTGTGEKGDNWRARDLLSLLVRSNMSADLPEDQRMSDQDVMSQVPTFFVAGHETTSTGTTFALLALTERPDVQIKLRQELLAVPTDTPTMEQLNALPYLDIVVRECLRLYCPAPLTGRTAMKDDIVPLAHPYTDRNGVVHDHLRLKKGAGIFIPIVSINRDKDLWGDDADVFNPDRWQKLPEAVTSIPGVWGNMLTFLGGSHACIGWRFAIVEMKALLFTLVRSFEFELAVPREDVLIKKVALVQRPEVRGQGNQLPFNVKLVVPEE
ncbi:hypothetical protein VNI00_009716 [Paramarasmius palmivorus]|uniref:Cytochrome P450 n=1 Tax=Paramarasmius palmivorus TaxID=297713 RepID=A0AAW0CQT4_9AGAR